MSNTPLSGLSTNNFTFLDRPEYFIDLTQRLQQVGQDDRVLLACMGFEPLDRYLPELVAALCGAAKRGATVHFAIDAYALTYSHRQPLGIGALWWHGEEGRWGTKHQAIVKALASLRACGVQCAITNQPHSKISLPFVGRSHIKTAIINDVVYVGGINLHRPDFADLMVRFTDTQTADWLYMYMRKMVETQRTREAFGKNDLQHTVDESTELLLDVGVKKQSVILQQAQEIIDHAQKWVVITCQYFPDGVTAQALKRAHERGVVVRIIFASPAKHEGLDVPLQYAALQYGKMRMPKEFFQLKLGKKYPHVHAKLLANEQEAIIGSHNYVGAGVQFGTAELALHRRDSAFAHAAVLKILSQIGLESDARFNFLRLA